MLTIRWPSLRPFGLFSSSTPQAIDLSPVEVHDIETAHEKPARALKHLVKLNHVENSLFDHRNFPNQIVHVCDFYCFRDMNFSCMQSPSLARDTN